MIIAPASRLQHVKEYYFSTKLKEIQTMRDAGQDVINMGIGSPDLMPSKDTIQALYTSAQEPQSHGYQPYQGLDSLREAIATFAKTTFGLSLHPGREILPLMGSKEGITHISLTFLNSGDEVLVPELGYPAYTAVSKMVGAKVRTYPLRTNDWQPDLEAMENEDYSKVKLMWINYPHMPTGTPPDSEVLAKVVEMASDKQFLICHDNPYSLVLNSGSPFSMLTLPNAKEVCIELNSLSKSHNMAGWRVGWVAGKESYLKEILKIKSNIDSGMFKSIQVAAIEALKNPSAWHEGRNREYEERRQIVYSILDTLGCLYKKTQEGMFVWAKIPDSESSSEVFVNSILRSSHVFLTPGFIFGEKGSKYIRASLCNKKPVLNEALERVKHYKKEASV